MPRFLEFIKTSREAFLDRHYEASDFYNRMFSGLTYATWAVTDGVAKKYGKGLALDAGSGRGAWQSTLLQYVDGYESIEMAPRGNHRPTWLGNVTDMSDVPEARFDTVFCQQVLEHVPEPANAFREIHRVVKPGGRLLLTVPHLSRRHELPHDYYRYTQNGIEHLLKSTGFEVEYLSSYGGIVTFLHHQTSFLFPGLLMGIPGIAELSVFLNSPLSIVLARLDKLIDRQALLPGGIVAVGKKPART